jgi:hypothetical protein
VSERLYVTILVKPDLRSFPISLFGHLAAGCPGLGPLSRQSKTEDSSEGSSP